MRFTIWSNGGRFEYIVYQGEELIARSGLIYTSRSKAKSAMMRAVSSL